MNKIHIKKFFKGEYSFDDIVDYFRGNFRYHFYYSKTFGCFLPKHIGEQINMRIKIMDKECYNQGSCKFCGCVTTQLQMANKSCEGNCYPEMMSKGRWNRFNNGMKVFEKGMIWFKEGNYIVCTNMYDKILRKVRI